MRQVRVQGCLPTLAVLLLIVLLGAVAATAGLAVLVVTAGVVFGLAVMRAVRRALGGGPPPGPPGAPGGVQEVPPGWMDREEGPIVEAGPREPPGEHPDPSGPDRDDERTLPPRG